LLDWSLHPFTAAYFAAEGAARRIAASASRADEGNIEVWALDRDGVRTLWPIADGARVVLVTAPRATNQNLHAQAGVFTLDTGRAEPGAPPLREPLDTIIGAAALADPNAVAGLVPLMWRLLLPKTEAPKLLRLLAFEGFSAATLFPGYAGVVNGLNERKLWDK
jgi:hypothetical protein